MKGYQTKDPREIKSKFDCKCSETGKRISKGDVCVYYPVSKSVFHVSSVQAYDFYNWLADKAQNLI